MWHSKLFSKKSKGKKADDGLSPEERTLIYENSWAAKCEIPEGSSKERNTTSFHSHKINWKDEKFVFYSDYFLCKSSKYCFPLQRNTSQSFPTKRQQAFNFMTKEGWLTEITKLTKITKSNRDITTPLNVEMMLNKSKPKRTRDDFFETRDWKWI